MFRRKGKSKIPEPMPKRQLQKIVKGFKRQGGIIQMDDATDAYLESKMAEAITLNKDTILLRQNPTRARACLKIAFRQINIRNIGVNIEK
ncbi:MAG: hypothetical protein HFG53_17565 [Lachnospiraceae bacterium]|jgi:hypothetical protein|nr:hypothetical protein [Lachnospiraceae bacterium]